jgi:hypothetical protein
MCINIEHFEEKKFLSYKWSPIHLTCPPILTIHFILILIRKYHNISSKFAVIFDC